MGNLVRIDRNGTKYYEGETQCPRCSGKGIYIIGVCNGREVPSWVDNGICFQCGGSGKVIDKWVERTPEYEAKLEERRAKKRAKWEQEHAEELAKQEEERQERIRQNALKREAEKLEEERIKAEKEQRERETAERKANSKYVGEVGDKIDKVMTYNFCAIFEVPSFRGYGTTVMHIHNFSDEEGNTFIWKSSNVVCELVDKEKDIWAYAESGDKVLVQGTIKEHNSYNGEKQTVLTRCKCKIKRD